ncbi:hypothetical protein [Streptomyces sp. NPDC050738]|uniref:hypothetical protein n=1 Tax=Streptomyces sp. NPDC050738 TaxID=3154744 RepID=UPI00342107B4
MRKSSRRLMSVLATVAAGVSVAAISAAPAQAADDSVYYASTDPFGVGDAQTEFHAYGEVLYAVDYAKDGHGVAAQWRYSSSSSTHSYYWGGGYASSGKWNLSMAEGQTLQIRACLQDGTDGSPWGCGGWEYAKA